MTNFNPNPNPYVAIVTDYTDATLNQFARQLIEKYVAIPWKDTECGYACSDHASWQRRGFPVHYVHEATTDESNEDIHTASDTLALSDGSAEHTLHFARYAAAFMAETAKGTIPECDANRPCAGGATCQNGTCVTAPGGGGASGAGGASAASGSAGLGGGEGGNAMGGAPGPGVSASAGESNVAGATSGSGGAPAQAGGATSSGGTVPLTPSSNEPLACSCRVPGGRRSSSAMSALLVLAALVWRRRPRARGRPHWG
jgi:hypothetical protein